MNFLRHCQVRMNAGLREVFNLLYGGGSDIFPLLIEEGSGGEVFGLLFGSGGVVEQAQPIPLPACGERDKGGRAKRGNRERGHLARDRQNLFCGWGMVVQA